MKMSQHLFSIFSVCLKSTPQLEGVKLSVLHYFGLATRTTPQISLCEICLQISHKISPSYSLLPVVRLWYNCFGYQCPPSVAQSLLS